MQQHLRKKRDATIKEWYLEEQKREFPMNDRDFLKEVNDIFTTKIPTTTFYRIIKNYDKRNKI